jgi:DNA-binding transcriptional LysR family regulator
MNLSGFDLNLLKVLDALLSEGSTVAAARRVGLSQPAVSAALARLRLSLGDPLFVRQGQRLVPTDFATALRTPLRTALDDLEGLLSGYRAFDPARDTARFVLTGSDFLAELLMPKLARDILPGAPGLTFQLINLEPSDYMLHIREGLADLAIAPAFAVADWAERDTVFLSEFAVICRTGHPAAAALADGEVFPLDVFCALPHVTFSVEGLLETQSDRVLAGMGRRRRVAMTIADFSGVYLAVAQSDLIAVIPRELAVHAARTLPLRVYRPPFPVGPFPIAMAWHRRSSRNAAHRWLRETLARLLADLP